MPIVSDDIRKFYFALEVVKNIFRLFISILHVFV